MELLRRGEFLATEGFCKTLEDPVVGRRPDIKPPKVEEQEHLDTFDRLIAENGVRPTALSPLWSMAGYALGASTALMGEKAAMACTSACRCARNTN